MPTDSSDPFDPLDRIDPPDQWDDITARAADASVDVDLDAVAGRHGRRPRTRALLAVAAALVLVIGGIALTRVNDDDDDELNATSRGPGVPLPGACPFSLDLGDDATPLESTSLSPDEAPGALVSPTVGRTTVDGIEAVVAVSSFPTSDAQGQPRWSGAEEAAAVGWIDGSQGVATYVQGTGGASYITLGGGHLGAPDDPCRDVYVEVRVPDPSGSLESELDRLRREAAEAEPDPAGPTPAPTTVASPGTTLAPTSSSTTTAPAPSGQPDERTPPSTGPVVGTDTTIDPPATTTTTTTLAPPAGGDVTGSGSSGSCVGTQQPCDDTADLSDDIGAVQVPPEVIRRGEHLIDQILEAIRFPEPTTTDGDDTATEDWTAVPGECPFYLDPSAGLAELEPAEDLGVGRSFDPESALVPPTVGVGRVDDAGYAVAVGTLPDSEVQRQDRWASPDEAGAIGWFDDNGLDPLRDAAGLQLDADRQTTIVVAGGGHLGGVDEQCRDVLVLAYVSEGTDAATAKPSDDAATPPSSTTTTAAAGGAGADPSDTDAATARGEFLIEEVLQAIRFPGAEDPTPSTAVPTTGPPTTAASTTGSPSSGAARASTLLGPTVVEGVLASPPGTPFVVGEELGGVLCVAFDDLDLGCSSAGSPSPGDPTPRSAGDPAYSSLYYGYLPDGATGALLINDDGLPVEAGVSPDGRIWTAPDPSPLPFGDAPQVTIRYRFPDGRTLDVPGSS